MKNSKLTKIIAVVASAVLIICTSVAITVMADGEVAAPSYTEDVGIISMNVSYQARTELTFAVSDKGVASEGAKSREVYLLFFNSNPDENGDMNGEELYRSAAYRKSSAGKGKVLGEEADVFYSNGILARDLAKDIYVCPVVVEYFADHTDYTRGYTTKSVDGADPIYSARACSVVSYARQQIETRNSFKNGELELYSNILLYASAVANKEGDVSSVTPWLIVNGGAVGKTAQSATQTRIDASVYAPDETVFIRANAKQDGEYFLYWKDVYGNVVTTDRVYDAPARNAIGLAIYTAVYGTDEQSVYTDFIDFDSMEEGELVPYEIPTEMPADKYTNTTAEVGGMTFGERVFWQLDASGNIEVAAREVVKIVKNEDNGALVIDKSNGKFSPAQTIVNELNDNAKGLEMDIKLNKLNSTKNNIRIMTYSDGKNGDVQFAICLHFYSGGDGTYNVYVSSRRSSGNYLFNKDLTDPATVPGLANMKNSFPSEEIKSYKIASLDEVFTVRCSIDDSGAAPIARVYINGELMFIGTGAKINNSNPNGYFESSSEYVSGALAINKITIQADTALKAEIAIDNIAFLDK